MITARRFAFESASSLLALQRVNSLSAGASAVILAPSRCCARSHASQATCTSSRKHTNAARTTQTPRDAGPKHILASEISQKGPSSTKLSPAGLKLQSDIRSGAIDPLSTLKSALRTSNSDFELVRVCLTVYEDRLRKLSRRQRLASIKAEGLGGLTLDWLWQDDQRWAKVFQYDVGVFETLAFFLVAEGLQKYVIGIIRLDSPVRVGLDARWRGQVFRCLVSAQLRSKTDLSADDVLDTFFALNDEIRHARQGKTRAAFLAEGDNFWKTSLWPPMLELFGELVTSLGSKHTSPEKYRRFTDMFLKVTRAKTPQQLDLKAAEVALHMPKNPDPGPFLALLKEHSPGATADHSGKPVLPVNPRARAHMYAKCHNLKQVLQQQNRAADAEWVTSFMAKHFDAAEYKYFREITVYPSGKRSQAVKVLKAARTQNSQDRFVDYREYNTAIGEARRDDRS